MRRQLVVRTDRQTDLPPSADVTLTLTHNSVSMDSVSSDDVMLTSRDTVLRHGRQQQSKHLQVTRARLQCIVASRQLQVRSV